MMVRKRCFLKFLLDCSVFFFLSVCSHTTICMSRSNTRKQPPSEEDDDGDQSAIIQRLLELSRSQISAGNGQQALEAVIRSIVANSGEESVMRILSAANNRAKLEKEREIRETVARCCEQLVESDSLLCEMGQEDILLDAFQDGSSVICQKCQGLISVDRAEAHAKRWCPALTNTIEEDDDEDDEDDEEEQQKFEDMKNLLSGTQKQM
jgi:hypothetical protein